MGLMQAGLEQRQREQLHQHQLQQQGSIASTSASMQLLQIQLQSQGELVGQQKQQQQWQCEQHRQQQVVTNEQAVVVAEAQAAVGALGVQAAVSTEVQNWQERQIDQLRHTLEQLQQQQQLRQENNEIKEIPAGCEQQEAKYLRGAISSLQAETHDLKQNVALSHPFEVETRHAMEDIGRLEATFTRRGIALSILNVANTQ